MSEPRNIILLEDDPTQAQWLVEEFLWKIDPTFDIRYFDSEHSITAAFENDELGDWQPTYAIVDLLVRYYSPQDIEVLDLEPSAQTELLPKEAGIRIRELIKRRFPKTKVAIVTVMDDRPEGGPVIQKGSDDLLENIGRFLSS